VFFVTTQSFMCIGSYLTTVFNFVYIDMHIVNICQPCIAFLQWSKKWNMVQWTGCCTFSVLLPLPPSQLKIPCLFLIRANSTNVWWNSLKVRDIVWNPGGWWITSLNTSRNILVQSSPHTLTLERYLRNTGRMEWVFAWQG